MLIGILASTYLQKGSKCTTTPDLYGGWDVNIKLFSSSCCRRQVVVAAHVAREHHVQFHLP